MNPIIGIDLGTTNCEVAIIPDGQPVVLPDEDGNPILPSVWGLDAAGRLLVGQAARDQYVLGPERSVRSIKRKMGQDVTVITWRKRSGPPGEACRCCYRRPSGAAATLAWVCIRRRRETKTAG